MTKNIEKRVYPELLFTIIHIAAVIFWHFIMALYTFIYLWRYITYIWKYAFTLIWRLVDNRLIRHALSARFAYERPPSITYYQARYIYDEKLCWFNHFEPILWFFWMLSESFTLLITNIPKRTVCGHSTRITQVLIWAFVSRFHVACLHVCTLGLSTLMIIRGGWGNKHLVQTLS